MKKWFIILAMLLMCLLVACARENTDSTTLPTDHTTATTNPDEPPRTEPTEPAPPAQVGDYLDVPENARKTEDLDEFEVLRVEITDDYGYHYIYALESSFSSNTVKMYIHDEYYFQDIVNEVNSSKVTRYAKDCDETKFILDEYADANTYAEDVLDFTNAFTSLTMFSLPEEGVRYRKLEDVAAETGPAYAYEAYYEDKLIGYLWVDQATGIMVRQMDARKQDIVIVTAISTENAGIPDYK